MDAYERVINARSKDRSVSKEVIEDLFDDYYYIKGDRAFGDTHSIIGGVGELENYTMTFIGIQKGKSMEEAIQTNFGMPEPHAYRKAIRLMKAAEKFKRPVVNFIDTPGAYPGVRAEEKGQHQLIADCLITMAGLKVPSFAFIIGEGGSGGALALALANKIYMGDGAVFSILSPEGFSSILYKSKSKARESAQLMRLTSHDLLEDGIIDGIVKEDRNKISISDLKKIILGDLRYYSKFSSNEIVRDRHDKFRKIGVKWV
ncbi:acetyl-CoA carboxylase carboxyl transferase subunit alpha [Anaerococcus sp. AGMB00486]|uniref:acetyl-CoA carboxytransferase n=2 Tax=Anaerococcus TaxID=165779 RepID=A0ABX2N9T2_9FIRM|nr:MULTISPECIES: carboxyl transferase domain-containing protein [Anaerococcus]MSS78331.1 acetyl-CoA carboxylase carboxyl transferase subunit alpha [Anaerococcus porci]NVF11445.1 acetyl-CoA carboxylase carboxyl transferase subunit alpha [Anaerococcus faecalis]